MISELKIIKGERLQQIAEMYIGTQDDFRYNPKIFAEKDKHCDIERIDGPISNPNILFCYGHCIRLFIQKLSYFKNSFVLITHNSDENILPNMEVLYLATHPLLKKWYAQNACVEHPKIVLLPIGLANEQWAHGDTSFFKNTENVRTPEFGIREAENLRVAKGVRGIPGEDLSSQVITEYWNHKTESIYFYFNLHTNYAKRNECYKQLRDVVSFLPPVPVQEYHETLSKYSFCICPEGNGVDTHRFWEALYVRSIPIVLFTPFIHILKKQLPDLPMVVIQSWADLKPENLVYDREIMASNKYFKALDLSYWERRIRMDTSL